MGNVGERLRKLMEIRDIKQIDISKATGVDRSAISHYVKGDRQPRQDVLTKIANVYNIDEAWLLGYDVPMERKPPAPLPLPPGAIPLRPGVKIPVLGRVACGIPVFAEENYIGYVDVDEDLAKKGDLYALVAKGNSMSPEIRDGDIVIVLKQDYAESDDIVIISTDNENATCKRLKKYEHGIRLIGLNPSFEPIDMSEDEVAESNVRIWGKVIEARRKF